DCTEVTNIKFCRLFDVTSFPTLVFLGTKATRTDRGEVIEAHRSITNLRHQALSLLQGNHSTGPHPKPPSWPSLDPLPDSEVSLAQLWNGVPQQVHTMVIVLESQASLIGQEVTLDLSGNPHCRVWRLVNPSPSSPLLWELSEAGSQPDNSTTQAIIYTVLRDSKAKFLLSGGSSHKAGAWLKSIDSMAVLHGWPDSFRLENARLHMKGPARFWLQARVKDLTTLEDFKVAFRKTFVAKKKQKNGSRCRRESRDMCISMMAKEHRDKDESLADLRRLERAQDLYGFVNTDTSTVWSIGTSEVDIEIDNVVCHKVKVIVVYDSALPVDMLVGRTWTEQDHIAYLCMGDELRIGYRDDLPFCNIDLSQMKPSKKPLRVKETMVLPKRTVCWVTVETEAARRAQPGDLYGGCLDGLSGRPLCKARPHSHSYRRPGRCAMERASLVYRADLNNAMVYSLSQEVALWETFNRSQLEVLENFVDVLRQFFPGDPSTMHFLGRLQKYVASFRERGHVLRGEALSTFLHAAGSPDSRLPKMGPYVGCLGSRPGLRGYPCSLWMLFHSLTVNAYRASAEHELAS
ncbi:hypothetical protein HPB47_013184, partial [Ixodes persulcatus]